MRDYEHIIFQINGGIGKNVMGLGVCKAVKRQYPNAQLTVITPFTDVFLHCPYVDKKLSPQLLQYYYKDNIYRKQDHIKLMLQDPYLQSDFVLRRGKHLIPTWCEMNDIEYNGELPEIELTKQEKTQFKDMSKTPDGKGILVTQINGGPPPASYPNPSPNPWERYSWPRDLPLSIAQKVIDNFSKKYHVIQIKRADQLALKNARGLELSFRQICGLIYYSEMRLFIDSVCQHIAAAMRLPSTVFWGENSPEQFGYDIHDNVRANQYTLTPEYRNSFLQPFNALGAKEEEFPYQSEEDIIDPKVIIASMKKTKGLWTPNGIVDVPAEPKGNIDMNNLVM